MKTSELIGSALDWAVAKCEGYTDLRRNPHRFANDMLVMTAPRAEWGVEYLVDLDYSTNWSQGGQIIELEQIGLDPTYCDGKLDGWRAAGHDLEYDENGDYIDGSDHMQYGPTPLIAAMRCYVTSKLGDEVDIPKELLGEQ